MKTLQHSSAQPAAQTTAQQAAQTTAQSSLDRRGFIRSLFTLGGLSAAAPVKAKGGPSYFWCDLKNGNVGYPSGLDVPVERPGSVVKLVAAAALIDDSFNTNQLFECTGTYRTGLAGALSAVHCQKPHGKLDIVRAIGFSCNCFFAQATRALTARAFLDKARALGLASPVAGRRGGLFPANATSGSSLDYVLGLADDFKPSSLQLMRLAALIGTGPDARLPVLHSADDLDIVTREKPLAVAISARAHRYITEGMRLCATDGTARALDPQDRMHIAAKTGTTPHGAKFQSTIIGFFPYDKPRNAFCLFSPSGTSQDSAVPAARDFLLGTTW